MLTLAAPKAGAHDSMRLINPPIDELVISVQFATLEGFRSHHAGLIWKKISRRLPRVSEQAALPSVLESFGLPTPPTFQLQAFFTPPTPRFWFESESENDLLQVQSNRISRNWRKRRSDDKYPGFNRVFRAFKSDIDAMTRFFAEMQIGELSYTQCEISYVNLVQLKEGLGFDPLERITSLWSGAPDSLEGDFEDATISCRQILERDGERIGRIHSSLIPVIVPSTGEKATKFEITARGRPQDSSPGEMLRLLAFEHQRILETFIALSTSEMRNLWGFPDERS
jgi:uncharacterized protein (TIGR04255 family)